MNRRDFLLSSTALATFALEARAQGKPVNIGWLPDDMAPLYVARAFSIFEENGLSANFLKYTAGPPMFPSLLSKSLDVVEMGLTAIIIAVTRGLDLRIMFNSFEFSGSTGLVIQPQLDYDGPDSMRGRSIATPRNTVPYFALKKYLNKAGMTLKDIKYVDVGMQNAYSAFLGGDVDATWIWAPFQNMLVSKGAKYVVTNADVDAVSIDFWACRAEWLEQNEAQARVFGRCIDLAIEKLREDPAAGVKGVQAALNIDADIAEAMLKQDRFALRSEQNDPSYKFSMNDEAIRRKEGVIIAIQEASEFLLAEGVIKTMPDPVQLVDNRLLS